MTSIFQDHAPQDTRNQIPAMGGFHPRHHEIKVEAAELLDVVERDAARVTFQRRSTR
jgi:hypothetical protein